MCLCFFFLFIFFFPHTPFLVWDIYFYFCSDGPWFFGCSFWDGLSWDKLSLSHQLYTSLNAKLNSYNKCAIYIVSVTVPFLTPATSIAFMPQTLSTLCVAHTTCNVGYDCNTHIHYHAWSLQLCIKFVSNGTKSLTLKYFVVNVVKISITLTSWC